MKLIIAVIKPFRLEDVRVALSQIGVHGMMVSEIKGFGRQSGHTEVYRGAEYTVQYVPKVRVEVAISDDMEEAAIEAVIASARTGKIGDGKIFVVDLTTAVRVRTGETNDEAL